MNKTNIIITLFLMLILLPMASAVQISLKPATIDVPNMVQGGYYEVEYLLNVNSQEETLVEMTLDESPLNNWLTFEPSETSFYVSNDNPKLIKMIIQPGESVANGDYQGAIRFSIKSTETPEGETSVVVEPGLVSKLNITITSNRVTDCRVVDAKISNVEIFEPLELEVEVYNNGNIDAKPEIKYTITNQDQEEEIIGQKNDISIKPTRRETINAQIEQSLKPGQYFIDVEIPNCQGFTKTMTFDILEWGAKSSEVTLTNLHPEIVWNNVGDKIKIYAQAKNTGTQIVKEAQFVGFISLDGELVEVIATKSRQLNVGDEIAFEYEFTPKKSGRYTLNGMIQYDGKETLEKTVPINVNPKEEITGITTENILLFLAIAIVVALLTITYVRKNGK